MLKADSFKKTLFETTADSFTQKALALVAYQAENNPIYRQYLDCLRVDYRDIQHIEQIPFLPIEFFKYHAIISGDSSTEKTFESSGTTGESRSKHHVADLAFYEGLSERIFAELYGNLTEYHILALLPSYLERDTSSLVYMVSHFIRVSQSAHSGFYLGNIPELLQKLNYLQKNSSRKILLIGVTFALLDLAEQYAPDLSKVIVMETGGMKGRRREMLRAEVHAILRKGLNIQAVHSEYGMTELLSQGYSQADETFACPPWMRVLLREVNDPFAIDDTLRIGAVNVIDLANIDSCAFIATQDLGTIIGDNQFQILGRMDNSDIRGCNLLFEPAVF
jgi:hypothetical protein